MVKVGAGKTGAGGTIAGRVDGGLVQLVLGLGNVDAFVLGEAGRNVKSPVSGQAGRGDTIKHIKTYFYGSNEIGGAQAQTHGVAGFILREKVFDPRHDLFGAIHVVADGFAADGDAGKVLIDDKFGGSLA